MNPLGQLKHVQQLLAKNPTGVSIARICKDLNVSRPTAYRILDRLRKDLNAPIVPAKRRGLFRFEEGKSFELPGFWLSEGEITALLSLMHWMNGPEAGAFADLINPLQKRVERIATHNGFDVTRFQSLVAMLPMNTRCLNPGVLRTVCEDLLQGRRLLLHQNGEDRDLARTVSPQKLVRYRDNWYLDAYCHVREGLRCFALSRTSLVHILSEPAKRVPQVELKAHFADAYGIFGGPARHLAVLRFVGFAADYVESEVWHPLEEKSRKGNELILKVPYGEPPELIREILRWGDEVEVLEPKTLREKVARVLHNAVNRYES